MSCAELEEEEFQVWLAIIIALEGYSEAKCCLGQAGAIRLGISRALVNMNPDWKPILRQGTLFDYLLSMPFLLWVCFF